MIHTSQAHTAPLPQNPMPAPSSNSSEQVNHQRSILVDLVNRLEKQKEAQKRKRQGDISDNPLTVYERAARWFPRATDPFINIITMFRVGFACDADGPDPTALICEDDLLVVNMPIEDRALHMKAFKALMATVCGLRNFFELQQDPSALQVVIAMMDTICRHARSDDTTGLKQVGLQYVLFDISVEDQNNALNLAQLSSKTTRGFSHPYLAKLLCPHKHSAAHAEDPVGSQQRLANGEIPVTAQNFPMFLYDRPYNPNKVDDGLLRSTLCVRVYKHIFTGPTSARLAGKLKGRKCQAELNGLERTTPRTIAYAAVQARHMLCQQNDWGVSDGAFDNRQFFRNLVFLFETDITSSWATETLDWWDKQVFNKPPRSQDAPGRSTNTRADDDDESDFRVLITQRRRIE